MEDTVIVKLNIAECLSDFLWLVEDEEYELCAELRDELYEVYGELDEDNKKVFKSFLVDYLEEEELTDHVPLKGLLSGILN